MRKLPEPPPLRKIGGPRWPLIVRNVLAVLAALAIMCILILGCTKDPTVLAIHNRAFDGILTIDDQTEPFDAGGSRTFELNPGFYEVRLMHEADPMSGGSFGLSDIVMVLEGRNEHIIKPQTRNIHIPE